MNDLLSSQQLAKIVDAVVPTGVKQPLGVYAFSADHVGAELAREVERQVFYEVFSNTPKMLLQEYGPYEDRSLFFCVVDHRRKKPAGVMRIIIPLPDGSRSKTLNDIRRNWKTDLHKLNLGDHEVSGSEFWDIATLAVAPTYRGQATSGLVSLSLYQALLRSSLRCGIDFGIALLDSTVFRMTEWKFEAPFGIIDSLEPKAYLGSDASYPVYIQASEWATRLAKADIAIYELIFEGKGLSAAVSQTSLDLVELIVRDIYQKDGDLIDLTSINRLQESRTYKEELNT